MTAAIGSSRQESKISNHENGLQETSGKKSSVSKSSAAEQKTIADVLADYDERIKEVEASMKVKVLGAQYFDQFGVGFLCPARLPIKTGRVFILTWLASTCATAAFWPNSSLASISFIPSVFTISATILAICTISAVHLTASIALESDRGVSVAMSLFKVLRGQVELLETVTSKLDVASKDLQKVSQELNGIKAEFKKTKEELQQTSEDLVKTKDELQQTIGELRSECDRLNQVNTTLEVKCKELASSVENLEKSIVILKRARDKIVLAVSNLGDVTNTLDALTESVNKSFGEDIDNLNNQVADFKEQLDRNKKQLVQSERLFEQSHELYTKRMAALRKLESMVGGLSEKQKKEAEARAKINRHVVRAKRGGAMRVSPSSQGAQQ